MVRFQFHRVAVAADTKKAFLMIRVNERDRGALWFLWVKNVNDSQPMIEPLCFTRFIFGVRSSSFLLNSTTDITWSSTESHTLNWFKLTESFYVDDLMTRNVEERLVQNKKLVS